MKNTLTFLFIFLSGFLLNIPLKGQEKLKGSIEQIKLYGKSLEGNLAGDTPERNVSIYLPPGYHKNVNKFYPVIYFLHGFTDSDSKVFGLEDHWMNMPDVLDEAFSKRIYKEMILVTPDALTNFYGSMYSNSVTTGNWEVFIAKELVNYIDENYRTIPEASGRGLTGHSMGGYGALRIGQKYPEIFSSIYLLSPCCLAPENNPAPPEDLDDIKSFEDIRNAGFFTKIVFASAAAWSPNPNRPPFYLDLPYENGELQPMIISKWNANRPLVTIDKNIYNVKKLKAISFDAGDEDRGIASSIQALHEIFNSYDLSHDFEIYQGDHLNRIAERIGNNVMMFFDQHLSSEQLD